MVFAGSSQCWSRKPDTVSSAQSPVFPAPVYLVRKYPFGIITEPLMVSFHHRLKFIMVAFVISIKTDFVYKCIFVHDRYGYLRAKFCRGFRFSHHDRTHPQLGQAHNPVIHTVDLILKHVSLLLLESLYCKQPLKFRNLRLAVFRYVSGLFPFPSAAPHSFQYGFRPSPRLVAQLLVTTHSPYILGELNNLLYANNISGKVPKDSFSMGSCKTKRCTALMRKEDADHAKEND